MIVAISFLTHMPKANWKDWLAALGRALAPGGVLMFTAHGHPAMEPMGIHALDPDGFHFSHHSEQADLDRAQYGSAATAFRFVYRAIAACGLDLLTFKEGGFGYQDLYVVTPRRPIPVAV